MSRKYFINEVYYKSYLSALFSFFIFLSFFGQKYQGEYRPERVIDSLVITGQMSPRQKNASAHDIKIIGRAEIERSGLINAGELLNRYLNLQVQTNRGSGDSRAQLMGWGGGYTKILIDNIPVVGDQGLGSNLDLSKFNLDQIERIEILKGSMGVEYGQSAVAGIIHIITRKGKTGQWTLSGKITEESVGKEYDWIENGKGRHTQSLNIGVPIGNQSSVEMSLVRTEFQGFRGDLKGKNSFQPGKRGYLWQPKTTWNPSLNANLYLGKWNFRWRTDYLNEKMNQFSPVIETLAGFGGQRTYLAKDRDYTTQRWMHHFSTKASFEGEMNINLDFSYQEQTRRKQEKTYDIPARKYLQTGKESIFYEAKTLYSRGGISGSLFSSDVAWHLGYEVDQTQGFASWDTGSYAGRDQNQKLLNAGFFTWTEFQLAPKWMLRPGLRLETSTRYRPIYNYSLAARHNLSKNGVFRISVGSSGRNPNFEELYTYFVDSNHNLQGNPSLHPESAYTGSLNFVQTFRYGGWNWSLEPSTVYTLLQNRISLGRISSTPLAFRFLNLDTYESWLTNLQIIGKYAKWQLQGGISLLGQQMHLDPEQSGKWYYTPEAMLQISFSPFNGNLNFNLFSKFSGSSIEITEDKSLGISQNIIQKRLGYCLMDLTTQYWFWSRKIDLTAGVRNLLNVQNLALSTQGQAGMHESGAGALPLFYGRSFFIRMGFSF